MELNNVLKITIENFENEVLKAEKPVIIDFWADWCGPCKMLTPIIHELADELTNAIVCKVNIDEEPELAQKFGIMSIPTIIAMKQGKIVNKSVGLKSKNTISQMI